MVLGCEPHSGDCTDAAHDLAITALEDRVRSQLALTSSMQLLKSLPGAGGLRAIGFEREIGEIVALQVPPGSTAAAAASPGITSCVAHQFPTWSGPSLSQGILRGHHHGGKGESRPDPCVRKAHTLVVTPLLTLIISPPEA